MRKFETFDNKAVINNFQESCNENIFSKKIYGNEIVWTYLTGLLAKENNEIYKLVSGFKINNNHSIFFEGQPMTPYKKKEGNSYIDMALGSINIREKTKSGLEYFSEFGNRICFVEAKYFSDLSGMTEHSCTRNQMDRVIENLLCMQENNKFPNEVVFTLLTPRKFKKNYGSRMYSYKYYEYEEKLDKEKGTLAKKIELSLENKREEYTKEKGFIEERLKKLKLNWVTFEDIFEEFLKDELLDLSKIDITDKSSAYSVWVKLNEKIRRKL
ncbi:hypothetical protein [Psychrilyobacter atlanticus]|uniref:hypothetical protein n=1 Tax=Psychrilyobacter atlanticus TaxID=271091 RepID=UPI000423F506|nr:hypothetical protein [Psychrilyobacter atlanticus]